MSRSVTFLMMAFVFVLGGVLIWYFQSGAIRSASLESAESPPPMAAPAEDGTAYNAPNYERSYKRDQVRTPPSGFWGQTLMTFRQTVRSVAKSFEGMGTPRLIARAMALGVLFIGGFVIAYIAIKIAGALFSSSGGFLGGLFQIVLTPIWQLFLAFISTIQTAEWLQEQFGSSFSDNYGTLAYVVFAIISVAMMYGLSHARSRQA